MHHNSLKIWVRGDYTPQVEDTLVAVQIQSHYQNLVWDALIIQSVNSLGCDILWSEDLSDGQVYHAVRIENPLVG